MLNMLYNTINAYRARKLRAVSRNRAALENMPPGLFDYWARTAQHEFEGIPRDAFFYARASDALLTFFDCVGRSNRPCALPSKAADSVWHAWLRLAPAGLDAFCLHHYDRRIPHIEGADMSGGMEGALATCLVTARMLDGLDRAGPDLPRLFVTDRKLRMPGGFAYRVEKGEVMFSHMDARGLPEPAVYRQSGTTPEYLLAAGMIGQHDYDKWEARRQPGGGSCGTTGASCGTVSCDGGGGGDGGGCGSSCGGCGGGGGD